MLFQPSQQICNNLDFSTLFDVYNVLSLLLHKRWGAMWQMEVLWKGLWERWIFVLKDRINLQNCL